MIINEQEKWLGEFREAGTEKVRGELLTGRWSKEKRATARNWLERQDARKWQAARGPGEGAPIVKKRRWMMYLIGAIGVGFMAVRAFRYLQHGI